MCVSINSVRFMSDDDIQHSRNRYLAWEKEDGEGYWKEELKIVDDEILRRLNVKGAAEAARTSED